MDENSIGPIFIFIFFPHGSNVIFFKNYFSYNSTRFENLNVTRKYGNITLLKSYCIGMRQIRSFCSLFPKLG